MDELYARRALEEIARRSNGFRWQRIVEQLQPKQKQFMDAVEEYPVTFYGGAKGGGKSHGMRSIQLIRRMRYAGSTGAIFRRTYPELEANHIRPLFEQYPHLREYWNDSKKLLTFPNRSTLQFCHCQNEADVDLYQGREIHDLGIEEAGQWTETMITRLRGSNRSSKPGIKPRTLLTGNPGGIGHAYLKRVFIERRFKEREDPEDYTFIQAFLSDNPALLENDPTYEKRLDAEPNEALRKAFRFGNWDIAAGQFFSELRREIHLVDPYEIPKHWNRFGSYDYGFNHPAAFGWFAVDEDGNVVLYREHVKPKRRVDQYCADIKEFPDTEKLQPTVAGHDCWTQKSTLREDARPPTVAKEFEEHGIFLKRATIDRIQGAAQVRSYLAWEGRPNNKPRFTIFKTCPISYDCLTRMQFDPNRPEDVRKVDAVEGDPLTGDDAYDMIRMGLMSRPILSEPAPLVLPYASQEWAKREAERMEQAAIDQIKRQIEDQGALDGMMY